ncbi:MAG TPA: oligosaccharide flippase family protein [Erysipelotrichaceae bacterium]|nr:oligosaccharide flippase family protein [Erysipelotrichaceae bacterium]
MKENSRTKNALLNIIFGYIAQIGILVLSFVGRKIFLNYLSADYLGINGLYSNILTILSLAELGLDTAAVYSLYKPVAERDNATIVSLLKFFKKIYYVLAFGILVLGLCFVPFLKFLIRSDLNQNDLIIYYVLFLINTVASYFVAHKVALLSAFQQQRIQKIVTLISNIILQIMHIVVLVIWKNFYFYIIATICSTFLTNIILSITCSKIHPEIFNCTKIVKVDKKPIVERIKSTFLYKIGAVLINNTDNILISVMVSTVAVGYYSNYLAVISGLQGFLAIITTSMVSGIGNLAVKGNEKDQARLFDIMLLFYHMIGALGLIGFSLLFNNLITIWLGSEYLFDEKTVFIIAFNFYISTVISPVWMFREANGMFEKVKYILLIRALLNLILSILLGKLWGVFGILFATTISLFLTNFWIEPIILCKDILRRKQSDYWLKQLKYALISAVAFILCYLAIFKLGDSLLWLITKALIICLITFTLFVLMNYKTDELIGIKSYIIKK